MAAAGSTVGSAVGKPIPRGLSRCGFQWVPEWLGRPAGPWSVGLVLAQESALRSAGDRPVTRCIDRCSSIWIPERAPERWQGGSLGRQD